MLQILVFSPFLGKLQRWNQAVDAGELCLSKSYSRKTSLGIREQSAVEKKKVILKNASNSFGVCTFNLV